MSVRRRGLNLSVENESGLAQPRFFLRPPQAVRVFPTGLLLISDEIAMLLDASCYRKRNQLSYYKLR